MLISIDMIIALKQLHVSLGVRITFTSDELLPRDFTNLIV